MNNNRAQYILTELGHHLPYSIFGVTLAVVIMGVFNFFAVLMGAEHNLPAASTELFHILHPAHILLSSVVTTAMFWKYEKNLLKAVLIGFFGSVGICSLSDIVFPYFGGMFLGFSGMSMHICVLEHPGIVIPFAVVGILGGLLIPDSIERSTQYSHSAHVLVSSAASILYLAAYGVQDWAHAVGGVFIVTIVAVMVPCCVSDIVFPLWFVKGKPACNHRH